MKYVFKIKLLIFFFMFPALIFAQAHVEKNIKEFGAKGDGKTDDHLAFKKASLFFKLRRGNGSLIIPAGVYRVGKQFNNEEKKLFNDAFLYGETALEIDSFTNFKVEGRGRAIIKCNDGLLIGSFYPKTNKPFFHKNTSKFYDSIQYIKNRAEPGVVFQIINSKNIEINNIEINGNADNFIFGGNWGLGDKAYENISYGIYVTNSKKIKFINVYIHHVATDGMYITNLGTPTLTDSISLLNCTFNHNGRNQLSWTGGKHLKATNCHFDSSGTKKIITNPGAGLDLETEFGPLIEEGEFINCTFNYNQGAGMASGTLGTKNIYFTNCTFINKSLYSVIVDSYRHFFYNCKMYGTVLCRTIAKDSLWGVTFDKCFFSDKLNNEKMYNGAYVIGLSGKNNFLNNCVVEAYYTRTYFIEATLESCKDENSKQRIFNNTFKSLQANYEPNIALYVTRSCKLYNNHYFINATSKNYKISTDECVSDLGLNVFTIKK